MALRCLRVSSYLRRLPSFSFAIIRHNPLIQPGTESVKSSGVISPSVLSEVRRSFTSTNFLSRKVFNPDTDEIGPDTILFEGCDYNHWLITMDFPKENPPTREEMIETYVNTAAKLLGSVEEAKKKIYALSTTTYQGFQVECTEEMSEKFKDLPGVVFVLPDSYIDPVNKEYGGDKYVNGEIFPRPPPVQYERRPNRRREQNYGPPQQQSYQYQPPPQQQNYGSPQQQNYQHQPPQQQNNRPPLRLNYGPPPQQNYSPHQPNYGSPPQQNNIPLPPPQQNNGPPSQPNYGPPPQQNYGPPQQPNYASPPQQNSRPLPQQNYNPSQQLNYGQPARQNYGPPPPQQSYTPQHQQGYGPSSQHSYVPPQQQGYGNFNSPLNQNHAPLERNQGPYQGNTNQAQHDSSFGQGFEHGRRFEGGN